MRHSLRWALVLPVGAAVLTGGASGCSSCEDKGDIGCESGVAFTIPAGASPLSATSWTVCFDSECDQTTPDPALATLAKAPRVTVAHGSARTGTATLRVSDKAGTTLVEIERTVTLERKDIDCDLVCYSAVVELGASDLS